MSNIKNMGEVMRRINSPKDNDPREYVPGDVDAQLVCPECNKAKELERIRCDDCGLQYTGYPTEGAFDYVED